MCHSFLSAFGTFKKLRIDTIFDDDVFDEAIALIVEDEMEVSSIDSDDDDEGADVGAPVIWGGSRRGKLKNLDRRRVFYSHLLYQDFWGPQPIYDATYFKRFFKVPIGLFDDIVEKVVVYDDYFRQKRDAAGKAGLSPHQKIASSIRQLTSGVSSAEHDDKYRMSASTGLESMKPFCSTIDAIYAETALCHPTDIDINRLLDEGLQSGWPGCIGSVDCMHWERKNCPSA